MIRSSIIPAVEIASASELKTMGPTFGPYEPMIKGVPGRTWTTEVTIGFKKGDRPKFSLRLLASSSEESLDIEPHAPGIVQQVVDNCGLYCGEYLIYDTPWVIASDSDADRLLDFLTDGDRQLPVIVASIAEDSEKPNVDTEVVAKACLGLAHVVVLPAEHSWALTERFGKRLSVFGGATRIYLPGFTDDADPYGGHKLFLARDPDSSTDRALIARTLRWLAANNSIYRNRLDKDVVGFATIKNAALKLDQEKLTQTGASADQQLTAALKRIDALEQEIEKQREWEKTLSDEHDKAEERANAAEAAARGSVFRIQQLIEQVKQRGESPDQNIRMPDSWGEFADWCDNNLIGRVVLSPRARRGVKAPEFEDVSLAARCLKWLANEGREARLGNSDGSLRDVTIEPGYINAHCGSDEYRFDWQGRPYDVEWHIKSGGNTRDPTRCLRIYYFWDENSQQFVVADMPAHRVTDAS